MGINRNKEKEKLMNQKDINRINELYHKSKEVGLTPAEAE